MRSCQRIVRLRTRLPDAGGACGVKANVVSFNAVVEVTSSNVIHACFNGPGGTYDQRTASSWLRPTVTSPHSGPMALVLAEAQVDGTLVNAFRDPDRNGHGDARVQAGGGTSSGCRSPLHADADR